MQIILRARRKLGQMGDLVSVKPDMRATIFCHRHSITRQ